MESKKLLTGDTFRFRGLKCYFVSREQDGKTILIVYKAWSRALQNWSYYIDTAWLIDIWINNEANNNETNSTN